MPLHQGVPLRGQGGDGGLGLLPLLLVLRQGGVQLLDVPGRRARHALEGRDAEPVGPQDLQDLLLLRPVGGEETAALLLIRADLIELRRFLRQLAADGGDVRRSGQHPQAEHRVLRAAALQGHVQGDPGLQPRPPAQKAVLLALQAGDVLEVPVDLFADRPALLQNRLAEELLLPDGAALDEEAVLGPAIALQGVQGGGGLSLLVLGLRQRGGVPPQQRRPGGVRQPAGGLADLHTAQAQQLPQESVPAVGHGHDAELFHFYNGHFSASQPFRQ